MPIYLYRCQKCAQNLEVIQRISEEPLKIHEGECQGELTKQITTTAPPQFKGSGFYETDYKRKKR